MPKPLLRKTLESMKSDLLSCTREASEIISADGKTNMERYLRRPRSKRYMEIMHRLDTGGHIDNSRMAKEIIAEIQNELPEVSITYLLGIVAKCYLGVPYKVHTLDMLGGIITHYKSGETMPNGLERARNIALCGNYKFIEVYTDCLRAISEDGSVSVING